MANKVDRAGEFRGCIIAYGVEETTNHAVRVRIRCRIDDYYENGEWVDWRPYEVEAFGDVVIVKTNGDSNDRQVQALCQHAGWDGELTSIGDMTWQPMPCRFSVRESEYEGNISYRVEWLDGWDAPVGGMKSLDAGEVRKLAAKYGAKLKRAISGIARPDGPPPSPPSPEPVAAAPVGDDIGF